jgi:hypothetical protein
VLLNDPVTCAEPKSSSLAYRFSRIKRIKDTFRLSDARSVITDFQNDSAIASLGSHYDLAASDLSNSVDGVVEQVQKNLQEMVIVRHDHGKVWLKISNQRDLWGHAHEPQLAGITYERVEVC